MGGIRYCVPLVKKLGNHVPPVPTNSVPGSGHNFNTKHLKETIYFKTSPRHLMLVHATCAVEVLFNKRFFYPRELWLRPREDKCAKFYFQVGLDAKPKM